MSNHDNIILKLTEREAKTLHTIIRDMEEDVPELQRPARALGQLLAQRKYGGGQ